MVRVHILPMVAPADRELTLEELSPDEALLTEVAEYLDERKVIGMSLELLPVKLRGVSVVCNLQASYNADLERVEQDVAYALYTYLNPLVGGSTEGHGDGWEFGRSLNQGELYGIVRKIEGVEFIKILRVYETDLATGKQDPKPAGSYLEIGEDELIASGTHIVKAERAELVTMSTIFHGTSLGNGATHEARLLDHEPPRAPRLDRGAARRLAPRPTCATTCPAVYQDGDFGLRFLESLETTLDPIVGTLDVLSGYFHSTLAPRDVLGLLASWVGLPVDESWPDDRLREALARESEIVAAPRARRPGSSSRSRSRSRSCRSASRTAAASRGRPTRPRRRRLPRPPLWSTATHRSPRRPSSR